MDYRVTLYEMKPSTVNIGECYDWEIVSFTVSCLEEAAHMAELCAVCANQPLRVTIHGEKYNGAAVELIEDAIKNRDEMGGEIS